MSEFLDVLLPAVEQQMASDETPFVKEAFERLLLDSDLNATEAKKMIALCLADESERMLDEQRP
jgi:hypothetical protein